MLSRSSCKVFTSIFTFVAFSYGIYEGMEGAWCRFWRICRIINCLYTSLKISSGWATYSTRMFSGRGLRKRFDYFWSVLCLCLSLTEIWCAIWIFQKNCACDELKKNSNSSNFCMKLLDLTNSGSESQFRPSIRPIRLVTVKYHSFEANRLRIRELVDDHAHIVKSTNDPKSQRFERMDVDVILLVYEFIDLSRTFISPTRRHVTANVIDVILSFSKYASVDFD